MRVHVYARTSGDEADTGQDVKAQAVAVAHQCEVRGWEVTGQSLDDGVTGDTDPLDRMGFKGAVAAIEAEQADAIVLQEISRFSRQHPVLALLAWMQTISGRLPVISLADSHFNGLEEIQAEEVDTGRVLQQFLGFWLSWAERIKIKVRTALAMKEIKSGRRKTKSGRAPGRPCKVSKADAVKAFGWIAAGQCANVADAARQLSAENGADTAKDERTRKKRRIGRSTLSGAFERYGICDENPNGSETVSGLVGDVCGPDGSVSDTGSGL